MNLNEDWYQTAVKKFRIKEITEKFGKKDRIGYGSSGFVYKIKCDSGILAIKEATITLDDDDICVKRIKRFMNEVLYDYNIFDDHHVIFLTRYFFS